MTGQVLLFPLARSRDVTPGPAGYFITTRTGRRGLDALAARYGRAIWDGGDGAPELNRASADPRRPWM